jgi:hypothetical protein
VGSAALARELPHLAGVRNATLRSRGCLCTHYRANDITKCGRRVRERRTRNDFYQTIAVGAAHAASGSVCISVGPWERCLQTIPIYVRKIRLPIDWRP